MRVLVAGKLVDLVDCERGKYVHLLCSVLQTQPVPHGPRLGDVLIAEGLAVLYGTLLVS